MEKLNINRIKNFNIRIINWIGALILGIYLYSMVIFPLFEGNFSWKYLQSVWHSWQGLNVGILAFVSSVIALNISRYNANKQRERNFIAARAFLPEAFSELTKYFNS